MADRTGGQERLLCDTSFISHLQKSRTKPERYSHWNRQVLERINAAILAISVVTLAETRSGFLDAKWGNRKIAEAEQRLAGFLHVPLSMPDINEWARLKHEAKRNGWNMSHNDFWIAATASTRGWPLVSCDNDHFQLAAILPIEVIGLTVNPAE